jgi:maltoporin
MSLLLVYDFYHNKTNTSGSYATLKFWMSLILMICTDPSKWTYDLGTVMEVGVMVKRKPINSSDNVIVAGGNLKSLLKVGSGYTSRPEIRR